MVDDGYLMLGGGRCEGLGVWVQGDGVFLMKVNVTRFGLFTIYRWELLHERLQTFLQF